MPDWISPNAHNDPDSKWSCEALAYDENVGTPAFNAAGDNGHFLELYSPYPVQCSKVRIYALKFTPPKTYANANVDIDVYYDDGWHDLFDGLLSTYSNYNEKTLPAEQIVTAVRIRHNSASGHFLLAEFDFYGDMAGARALVGGSLAKGGLAKKGLV